MPPKKTSTVNSTVNSTSKSTVSKKQLSKKTKKEETESESESDSQSESEVEQIQDWKNEVVETRKTVEAEKSEHSESEHSESDHSDSEHSETDLKEEVHTKPQAQPQSQGQPPNRTQTERTQRPHNKVKSAALRFSYDDYKNVGNPVHEVSSDDLMRVLIARAYDERKLAMRKCLEDTLRAMNLECNFPTVYKGSNQRQTSASNSGPRNAPRSTAYNGPQNSNTTGETQSVAQGLTQGLTQSGERIDTRPVRFQRGGMGRGNYHNNSRRNLE